MAGVPALAAVVLALAVTAVAEDDPPLSPGSLPVSARARLFLREAPQAPLYGIVTDQSATSVIMLMETGGELTFPLTSLARLDVSVAKRRKTLRGALIGVGAGALLGAFIPVDPVTCNEPDSRAMCSRGEAFAGGIGLGALVGGLTGYAMRRETWMPVDLGVPEWGDRGPTLLVGPGPTLRVAVRF